MGDKIQFTTEPGKRKAPAGGRGLSRFVDVDLFPFVGFAGGDETERGIEVNGSLVFLLQGEVDPAGPILPGHFPENDGQRRFSVALSLKVDVDGIAAEEGGLLLFLPAVKDEADGRLVVQDETALPLRLIDRLHDGERGAGDPFLVQGTFPLGVCGHEGRLPPVLPGDGFQMDHVDASQ